MAAFLAFFTFCRRFFSPRSHRWQKGHIIPFLQPLAWWKAHGLQTSFLKASVLELKMLSGVVWRIQWCHTQNRKTDTITLRLASCENAIIWHSMCSNQTGLNLRAARTFQTNFRFMPIPNVGQQRSTFRSENVQNTPCQSCSLGET